MSEEEFVFSSDFDFDTDVLNSASDSSDGEESSGAAGDGCGDENELDGGQISPKEHLATVFSFIDLEAMPSFDDWQSEDKVFCRPDFKPDVPPGRVGEFDDENMEPIDYFSLFYDDDMLQQVSRQSVLLFMIMMLSYFFTSARITN